MTLSDVVRQIGAYDEQHCIYARPRWRPASPAVVAPEPPGGAVPSCAAGMTFMITVAAAKRAIAARAALRPGEHGAAGDRCRTVIYYAVYDAAEPLPSADADATELALAI